jgi:hypothetical protein
MRGNSLQAQSPQSNLYEKSLRMKPPIRHRFVVLLFCASLLLLSAKPAAASIPTQGQVVLIFVGVAAIGAVIGVGIYYAARHNGAGSLTGCAIASDTGLSLQHEGDPFTYTLLGDTAAVKPGERIRISGKKRKAYPSGNHEFLVDKISKVYGPCKALPTTP